jgi:hypothetical protein
MDLVQLIERNKDGRSYNALAVDCGITAGRLHQMASGAVKEWPKQDTIRGLAVGLRVSESTVVLAIARTLHLDVANSASSLENYLPAGVDRLTERQRLAIGALIRSIVEADTEEGGTGVATQPRRGEVGLDLHPHVTAQVKADSELAGRNVPRSSRGRARVVRRRPRPSAGNREVKGDEGATSEADD